MATENHWSKQGVINSVRRSCASQTTSVVEPRCISFAEPLSLTFLVALDVALLGYDQYSSRAHRAR